MRMRSARKLLWVSISETPENAAQSAAEPTQDAEDPDAEPSSRCRYSADSDHGP